MHLTTTTSAAAATTKAFHGTQSINVLHQVAVFFLNGRTCLDHDFTDNRNVNCLGFTIKAMLQLDRIGWGYSSGTLLLIFNFKADMNSVEALESDIVVHYFIARTTNANLPDRWTKEEVQRAQVNFAFKSSFISLDVVGRWGLHADIVVS